MPSSFYFRKRVLFSPIGGPQRVNRAENSPDIILWSKTRFFSFFPFTVLGVYLNLKSPRKITMCLRTYWRRVRKTSVDRRRSWNGEPTVFKDTLSLKLGIYHLESLFGFWSTLWYDHIPLLPCEWIDRSNEQQGLLPASDVILMAFDILLLGFGFVLVDRYTTTKIELTFWIFLISSLIFLHWHVWNRYLWNLYILHKIFFMRKA